MSSPRTHRFPDTPTDSAGAPPEPAPGFRWRPAAWGWTLEADRLSPLTAHGWTTRQLSLGRSDDGAGWDAVAEAIGVPAGRLHRMRQVHGVAVHLAAGSHPEERPEADIGVAGPGSGAGVAVQVADCAPLLLADARTGAVAAAHAGWRGTAADAAGETVRALARLFGTAPGDIVAGIGPCIGPCCYEVGPELVGRFAAAGWDELTARWFSPRGERQVFDLWTANRDQLERAGVPPDQIAVSALCSACHPGWFYSYRRDGPGAGRMAGFIRPRTT